MALTVTWMEETPGREGGLGGWGVGGGGAQMEVTLQSGLPALNHTCDVEMLR